MWDSESQLQGRKWKWARWRKHLHGDTCSSGKTQREWRMTSAEMRVSDLHHGRSATLASLWNKRHKDWTSASSDKIRGKIAHDRGQSILIKKKCILATILSLRNVILKQQLQECIVHHLVMEYALSLMGRFCLYGCTMNRISHFCTCTVLLGALRIVQHPSEKPKSSFQGKACKTENDLVCRCASALQCFPFSPSAFSPSLSCTHARLVSVGVWWLIRCKPHCRLTIFGLPGNRCFLSLCRGEKQPLQGHYHQLSVAFSFFCLSQQGLPICGLMSLCYNKDKYVSKATWLH